ncbi:DUF418 domain-containing protein [Brevibacillus brevis]|nr:DUF418 domain-containing protein [Brevibacillus brevis]
MTNMQAEPISQKDRIYSIDIVRGLALFGILLVNLPSFIMYSEDVPLPIEAGIDAWIRLSYDLFIQTKFFGIFSFLFGLGFYIFMSRAEQRGQKVFRLFSRRLLAMFAIGVIHIFIWFGDILAVYALLGFLLMPFYRRKPSTILAWAGSLGGVYMLTQGVALVQTLNGQEVYSFVASLQTTLIPIFVMFLFGLYAGSRGLIAQIREHKPLLKRIAATTLVISLPIAAGIMWASGVVYGPKLEQVNKILVDLSTLPMALCFIASLFLLLDRELARKILQPFAYTGQMGLTTYLGQTVIMTILIPLFGITAMPLSSWLLLAFPIYAFQLLVSWLWLKRFNRGPMEKLWRFLTYGRKKKSVPAPAN